MTSKKNGTDWFDLDFERDMPLTSEDLEAMARSRRLRPLSGEEYQRWVDLLALHHPPERRLNTDSDEPFEL
jgi:hypothetical protein